MSDADDTARWSETRKPADKTQRIIQHYSTIIYDTFLRQIIDNSVYIPASKQNDLGYRWDWQPDQVLNNN